MLSSTVAEIRDTRWLWRRNKTPFQWLLCFPLGTRPSGRVFFLSYVFYLSRFLHICCTFFFLLRNPTTLWLQGGTGASGVGIGNFEEIGPLDAYLKPRNSTWLKKADLLFVDNPVGTWYNYVEDLKLLVKSDDEQGRSHQGSPRCTGTHPVHMHPEASNLLKLKGCEPPKIETRAPTTHPTISPIFSSFALDDEAATDQTTLLIEIFNRNETLQKSSVYIVAESYGGKYDVPLGLCALKAIEARKFKLKLGGIALGDTWKSDKISDGRRGTQGRCRRVWCCGVADLRWPVVRYNGVRRRQVTKHHSRDICLSKSWWRVHGVAGELGNGCG